MSLLDALVRWLTRYALFFVLIVAAMALYGQYRQAMSSTQKVESSITRIEGARVQLAADIKALRNTSVTSVEDTQRNSLRTIDSRLVAATTELEALQSRRPRAMNPLSAPQAAIVAVVRHDIRIELLNQEIAFLYNLRRTVETRGQALAFDAQIADLDARIAGDAANIAALPPVISPRRYVRQGLTLRDLAEVYAERQAANCDLRSMKVISRQRLGEIGALATPKVVVVELERLLEPLETAGAAQSQALEASLEREAQRWYKRLGIGDLLWPALWALVGIVLMPFAIRTVFYWVLVPLAALQKPIQLFECATPIPLPVERSAVSKTVALEPGTELLVRQGFQQTVSLGGTKATQWLLDSRHPISSIVAGLYFLTRIRGSPNDTITVSATHDPFAEVALLTLPAGAAAVLQPRAIAGVVQPMATPLRITSHWRLGTLSAWLTWQLRFLVFHGPAQIVLTGGRGVRIEPAQVGRSIGQDQLIGFSAGIAYSTGRTETFVPYLFGREPLLKDRVAAGSGVLIAEEAPQARRAKRGVRHGLEGTTDAFLKVFGI